MKLFQLHIIEIIVHLLPIMTIEITVHLLPIMTSYLAIATSLLVLQRRLNAIRLHTDSFENTV